MNGFWTKETLQDLFVVLWIMSLIGWLITLGFIGFMCWVVISLLTIYLYDVFKNDLDGGTPA